MDSERSPKRQLAEILIGQPLDEWVAENRLTTTVRVKGWRRMADDLHERTGHRVMISGETLRQWFSDVEPAGEDTAA